MGSIPTIPTEPRVGTCVRVPAREAVGTGPGVEGLSSGMCSSVKVGCHRSGERDTFPGCDGDDQMLRGALGP